MDVSRGREGKDMAQESGDRIAVKCPHCGAAYDVPADSAGRAISCEHCHRAFTAPFVASLAGHGPDASDGPPETGAALEPHGKADSTPAALREVVRAIHGLERETAAVADGAQKTGKAVRLIALLVLIQFVLTFLTGLYMACSGGS